MSSSSFFTCASIAVSSLSDARMLSTSDCSGWALTPIFLLRIRTCQSTISLCVRGRYRGSKDIAYLLIILLFRLHRSVLFGACLPLTLLRRRCRCFFFAFSSRGAVFVCSSSISGCGSPLSLRGGLFGWGANWGAALSVSRRNVIHKLSGVIIKLFLRLAIRAGCRGYILVRRIGGKFLVVDLLCYVLAQSSSWWEWHELARGGSDAGHNIPCLRRQCTRCREE